MTNIFNSEKNPSAHMVSIPKDVGLLNANPGSSTHFALEDHDHQLEDPLLTWLTWNGKFTVDGLSVVNMISTCLYQKENDHINLEGGVAFTGVPAAGNFKLELPVLVNNSFAGVLYTPYGQAYGLSAGVNNGPDGVLVTNNTNYLYITAPGNLNLWNNGFPWVWKNTDYLRFIARYRWR